VTEEQANYYEMGQVIRDSFPAKERGREVEVSVERIREQARFHGVELDHPEFANLRRYARLGAGLSAEMLT
jgi:hypothetical protein